jgi:hypothetical protein
MSLLNVIPNWALALLAAVVLAATGAVVGAALVSNSHAAAQQSAAAKAAAEKAAAEKAAAAKAAAEKAAAAKAAAVQVIKGKFTVPDINGALVTQVGGYPGQPLGDLTGQQLDKMGRLLDSLAEGKTYPCPGGSGGGFDDLVAGAQVVVEDGARTVLATSTLTGGVINTRGCTFTFKVQVPDADFYRVTVTHRGTLTYSRNQMVANGWRVTARL